MYTGLTCSRIREELASAAYLWLGVIENNYFAMYTRLTLFRIGGELASLAYFGLGII